MKHILLFLAIALTACNAEVSVDTPISEARAVFAAQRGETAANIGVTGKGVTATYFNPDASFHLRFDQFAVIEMDSCVEQVNAAVFQLSPGVWIAELRNGDYIRINAMTGRTEISYTNENGYRIFRAIYEPTKMPTP